MIGGLEFVETGEHQLSKGRVQWGVAKLINVRGSIWVVRGNTYSQMTYLSHLVSLVSLWMPPPR